MNIQMNYSNSINYFDWPSEWRLDQDDAEQVAADRLGHIAEIRYLQDLIKRLEVKNGTQENFITLS